MESLQAAQTDIEKVVAINFKTRYFAAVRVKIILSSLHRYTVTSSVVG